MTCPFLNECEREVTHSHFRDICCTEFHKSCTTYQETVQKELKKPREWMRKW